MFEFLGTFLWLIVTGVASIGGYITVKKFVRDRLRFVEGVHRPGVPLISGIAASLVTMPTAIILTPIAPILFGIGIGTGVAAGRRDLKRLPGA